MAVALLEPLARHPVIESATPLGHDEPQAVRDGGSARLGVVQQRHPVLPRAVAQIDLVRLARASGMRRSSPSAARAAARSPGRPSQRRMACASGLAAGVGRASVEPKRRSGRPNNAAPATAAAMSEGQQGQRHDPPAETQRSTPGRGRAGAQPGHGTTHDLGCRGPSSVARERSQAGVELVARLGHRIHAASGPRASRIRPSARESRDLTVPRAQPRVAAISASSSPRK